MKCSFLMTLLNISLKKYFNIRRTYLLYVNATHQPQIRSICANCFRSIDAILHKYEVVKSSKSIYTLKNLFAKRQVKARKLGKIRYYLSYKMQELLTNIYVGRTFRPLETRLKWYHAAIRNKKVNL